MDYEEISDPPSIDGSDWLYAVIIRKGFSLSTGAKFFTDPSQPLQVAYMRFPPGHVIPAHTHLDNRRYVERTQEVFIVRSGSVALTIYRPNGETVATRTLREWDTVYILCGGHKFDVSSDGAEIMEVKTGPYYGRDKDKRLL